jgi:hypothetical protein
LPRSDEFRDKSQLGSAVVEFVLISVPLVLLAVTTVTIALTSFVSMVIRDSAVEGARFAALADQNSDSGCLRAQQLISAALMGKFVPKVSCHSLDGLEEIVMVNGRLQMFGFLPGVRDLSAIGRAPREF